MKPFAHRVSNIDARHRMFFAFCVAAAVYFALGSRVSLPTRVVATWDTFAGSALAATWLTGLTNAEALAAATIVPARLVGRETKTGSIKVGKAADLVLVEGDPSTRLGDLRQTRLVVMDGKMMHADALRTAAGFSGRPKQPGN